MHVTFEERLFGEESPNIEEFRQKNRFKQVKFAIFLGALQLALLCLFVRFTSYALKADASVAENGISVALGGGAGRTETGQLVKNITLQIILIVVYVSSSCSATKLRGFSTGSHVFNLLVVTLGFQWALLNRGFFYLIYQDLEMIRIDVHDLTEAFLAAFSLSLSNSFILGRTSSINTLVIIIIHIPLYTGSKLVSEEILLITDPGSALSVHLFGAVFGCCVHNFLTQSSSSYSSDKMEDCREHENNSAVLISSAILFVSLPMLNGIISESDDEMTRAIINTILAGASSLVTSITIMVGMSHLKNRSFNSHVLQGCLVSGGISVASVATLMIQPYGATAIGIITGAVTTLNYLCLEPLFRDSWNLPCSSGIFSFHGVSAMISSVAAIVMASMSEDTDGLVIYHNSLYPIYPARVPSMNYTKNLERIGEIISNYPFLEDKAESRSAYQQAGYQGVGLLISFTTAAIGGIFTGYILRFSEERCGNTMPCTVWQDESFILNRRRYYEGRKRSSVGLEIPDIEVSSF